MKSTIVSIAEADDTARALDSYLKATMGAAIDSYFMTYRRTLLSGSLVRVADLFIVELFSMDNLGLRAEGILAAEKWTTLGKRCLIVSGGAIGQAIRTTWYWDLASNDLLTDRVRTLLAHTVPSFADYADLRRYYDGFCRAAEDPHTLLA